VGIEKRLTQFGNQIAKQNSNSYSHISGPTQQPKAPKRDRKMQGKVKIKDGGYFMDVDIEKRMSDN